MDADEPRNLNCVYCIAQDKMDPKAKNDDPLGTAEHILSLHPLSVVISGGEPTLHSALPTVLDRFAGKTALILDSNGTVPFHKDLVDALRRADASVRISIDSADPAVNGTLRPNRNPDADDLSAIEANLLLLLREHIFTSVHTVVTTVNRAALFGLGERLALLGIRRWHLYGLLAVGRGRVCFSSMYVDAETLFETQKDLAQRFPDMRITFSLPNEAGAGGAFPIADSAGRFFVEPDGCALVCPEKDPKRPTAKELGELCSGRYV